MASFDKFSEVVGKYNTLSPGTTKPKPPARSRRVQTVKNNREPKDIWFDEGVSAVNTSGILSIGNGPMYGPANMPVFIAPEPVSVMPSDLDDIFGEILTTTTSYIKTSRDYEIPKELNTKQLMFIKDRIEEGYSYIKIKNLDELRPVFKRLGCYVVDYDVSTTATVGVFPLGNGLYVVIN